MKNVKETEDGKRFEWVDTGHGSGFWSVITDSDTDSLRQPLACPACDTIMYNWDASFYNKWGVCSNCYIGWFEGRENLPDFKNDNRARAAYVKEKIAEKRNSR